MNLIETIQARIKDGTFGQSEVLRKIIRIGDDELMTAFRMLGEAKVRGFRIDNDNREVYLNLLRWLVGNPAMECRNPATGDVQRGEISKGLFIGGSVGSGKTTAILLLDEMARLLEAKVKTKPDAGKDDKYKGESLSLVWNSFLASDICDIYAQTGDVTEIKRRPVLVIQDLGAEPKETIYMGNRMNVMRNILEARGDDPYKMTIITSNLKMDGDAIKELYGDRVVSRLHTMCNFFVLRGTDYRKR